MKDKYVEYSWGWDESWEYYACSQTGSTWIYALTQHEHNRLNHSRHTTVTKWSEWTSPSNTRFTWDKWGTILSWAITMAAGASASDINSQHADVACLLCAAVSQSRGFAWFDSSDYLPVVGWRRRRQKSRGSPELFFVKSHAPLQDDRANLQE